MVGHDADLTGCYTDNTKIVSSVDHLLLLLCLRASHDLVHNTIVPAVFGRVR